jgi:hypothetical protein
MSKLKNTTKLFSIVFITGLIIAILAGCGKSSETALPVGDLSLAGVSADTNTDADTPATTYSAKVTWTTDTLMDDKKGSAALEGIRVSTGDFSKDLDAAATDFTFTGLVPAELHSLNVMPIYKEGTYETLADGRKEVVFRGGPWYASDVNISGQAAKEMMSVGSFNHADAKPTGTYSFTDFYYWNPEYNPEYTFADVDDECWFIVKVHEPTDTNDTDEQRNNINWLSDDVALLDANTEGLDTYDDMADVDLEIYDVNNNKLFELTGTDVEGTIDTADFDTLLDSVNSGYYADREGHFFIRATCKAMPANFSDDNSDQKGWWGLAMYGPRVEREAP